MTFTYSPYPNLPNSTLITHLSHLRARIIKYNLLFAYNCLLLFVLVPISALPSHALGPPWGSSTRPAPGASTFAWPWPSAPGAPADVAPRHGPVVTSALGLGFGWMWGQKPESYRKRDLRWWLWAACLGVFGCFFFVLNDFDMLNGLVGWVSLLVSQSVGWSVGVLVN